MVTKKQLAANLARQAREHAERDLDDLYDTFRRNPTATMFEALLGKMRAFQEAVNIQHEIARWEDE